MTAAEHRINVFREHSLVTRPFLNSNTQSQAHCCDPAADRVSLPVSITLHSRGATAMSQHSDSCCFVSYPGLLNSPTALCSLLDFFTLLCDDLSFQITYKYMEEHRAPHRYPGNPTTTLLLSGKLPVYCHRFFPICNNFLTRRRTAPLTL